MQTSSDGEKLPTRQGKGRLNNALERRNETDHINTREAGFQMWQERKEGEEKTRGMKSEPDEETAMAAERSTTSDTAKGCLPSQEQSRRWKTGIGEGERMSGPGLVLFLDLYHEFPWVSASKSA